MDTLKSKIFNYLTSSQKSELCHYISKFVKIHYDKDTSEIMDLFIEEEEYYLKLDSSRHPWIVDYIDDDKFHKDLSLYIKENQKKYQYKEAQRPYIEKQKELQKEYRKVARDRKMERERPTPKQISYYKALCRKFNIDINSIDLENASKLDLRNAIDGLLSEEHITNKQEILAKLNNIIKSRHEE